MPLRDRPGTGVVLLADRAKERDQLLRVRLDLLEGGDAPGVVRQLVLAHELAGHRDARERLTVPSGSRVRDIAAATGNQENTIRWHIKRIFRKHGVYRQADLVRLVLSKLGQNPG